MVTSIVNYKNVNEADLRQWLSSEFGYDQYGNPNFSYKPSDAKPEMWEVTAWRPITQTDVEQIKSIALQRLGSQYPGAVEY